MSKFGEGGEFRNWIAAPTQIRVHMIMHVTTCRTCPYQEHAANDLSNEIGFKGHLEGTCSFHSPFFVFAGENSGQNLGLLSWKKQRFWSSKVQRN